MARLEVCNVSFSYGDTRILNDVSISIPDGDFHALLGSSGSGKTTLLRIIAGFLKPDSGTILINGEDVTNVPPEHRDIGIVFQQYALFPHLTIWENIAFGLKMRKLSKIEITQKVAKALELVRLEPSAQKLPNELSGGQKQRAAVARALVLKPSLLLLDEPLSALDRKIRGELRDELARVHRQTDTTALLVTHDQEEALVLASEIVVIENGLVRQSDRAENIYGSPADLWVAGFVGRTNQFRSVCKLKNGEIVVSIANRDFLVSGPQAIEGNEVMLVVRPEEVSISSDGIPVRVKEIRFMGATAQVFLTLIDGCELESLVLAPVARKIAVGVETFVKIDSSSVKILALT
jgi:ABC-type Fe3+/spermidine/putrescine transport system ATPase subunit